jgi:Domain of unknown function (DUF4249)
MARKYFNLLLPCCLSALVLSNCKVPYDPPLKATDTDALIVEGYIDGAAPVTFRLSRSRILSPGDTSSRRYELGAQVSIEDDHQNTYPLTETGNGFYGDTTVLNLDASHQYRIHIFTSGGREYLSDLVSFKQSPAIDTIAWKLKDDGVQTFLNTHDPKNSTIYYRWEYSETWEIHAEYISILRYVPDSNTVVPRSDRVFACWRSDNSTNIYLGSSAKLASDVINEMPLAYIAPHDKKLSVLYSIWVKQYALDLNGYNYWLAIRNNTERVGSIFDPQPNETTGNVHCVTDPAEKVVGYIGAGNSYEKRTFINNRSLPTTWNPTPDCPLRVVPNNPDSIKYYFGGQYDPIVSIQLAFGLSYSASYKDCVDCTLSGTNIKPSFWP